MEINTWMQKGKNKLSWKRKRPVVTRGKVADPIFIDPVCEMIRRGAGRRRQFIGERASGPL